MPDEYISREAAIEEIDKWLDAVGTALVGKGLSYYGELIGCIEDARTADVAEVVRCRDCIRRYDKDECPMCFLIEGKYYEYTNGMGSVIVEKEKKALSDA